MLRQSRTVDPNRISSSAIALFFLGILDRVTGPLTQPRLDLVFGGDVPPYLQTADIMDEATNRLVRGRWYRVGVLNQSRVLVSDVQVQLWNVDPPEFPILPVTLHFMHDNPPPVTPYRLFMDVPAGRREPTVFVDVLAQYEKQAAFQVIPFQTFHIGTCQAVNTISPFVSLAATLVGRSATRACAVQQMRSAVQAA